MNNHFNRLKRIKKLLYVHVKLLKINIELQRTIIGTKTHNIPHIPYLAGLVLLHPFLEVTQVFLRDITAASIHLGFKTHHSLAIDLQPIFIIGKFTCPAYFLAHFQVYTQWNGGANVQCIRRLNIANSHVRQVYI